MKNKLKKQDTVNESKKDLNTSAEVKPNTEKKVCSLIEFRMK